MSQFRTAALASLAALLTSPLPLFATDSTLDSAFVAEINPGLTPNSYPTFDSGTGAVNAVALMSDGKIVTGGNISRYKAPPAGSPMHSLRRLLPDGALDTAFDAFSSTLADSQGQTEVNDILTVAGDKLYIGGIFTSYQGTSRSGILRLNADGSLDTSFNVAGVSNSNPYGNRYVFTIAGQPDGKVLAGGGFNLANNVYRANLARFHANGSLDTDFNANAALGSTGAVYAVAVLPDGKILVGGSVQLTTFTQKPALFRLNPDGSLDTSFQPPFADEIGNVQEVLPLPDGRVVISGFLHFPGYDSNGASGYLAALHADGSLDTTFIANLGAGPNGWVGGDLKLQPDGTILAAGIFNSWDGQPRASVARLQPDGTLDPALAVPPYSSDRGQYLTHFNTLAVQPDGKLVAGGWFSRVTDPALETYNLTRINNEFAPASPGVLRLLSTSATTAENAGSVTLQVSRFGGLVGAVSVNFATADGTATAGADYTAASGTLSWAAGEGGVKTITIPVLQDVAVESAETFTVTLSGATGGATIDPAKTQTTVTLRDDDSAPLVTRHPDSVSIEQGARFTLSVRYDSVLPATVQWQHDPDGAGPEPFADIPYATGLDYTVYPSDAATHAGDYRAVLTSTAGVSHSDPATVAIAIPAGSVDVTGFVSNSTAAFTKALPLGDGRYLAITNTGLVRINANGAIDTTFATVAFSSSTSDLLLQPDGKILVSGFFTSVTVNGATDSRTGLARFNADGTLDASFNLGLTHSVQSIASGADNKLYVGGTSGGGFKRFTSAGVLDTTFSTYGIADGVGTGNPNGYVWQIQELADGRILVAHQVGSGFSSSYRLQILTPAGAIDPTFTVPAMNWNVTGWDFLPDGRIAVVGRFGQLDGRIVNSLAILHPDGTPDTTFQSETNPSTLVGVRYHQGRLLVWGSFTTTAGSEPANLVRFNLDGSLDTSFSVGAGANGRVNSLHLTPAGDFDIFGAFSQFKGVPRSFAARLVGNSHIGAIGFAPPRVTTTDSGADLTLTLRRYGPATEAASIAWATADVTTTADEDYLSAAGVVTWAAGDSADKTITVTIVEDAAVEDAETFRVVLDSPSGPVTAAAPATVTLIDSDTPVAFTTQPSSPPSALFAGDSFTLSAATASPTPTSYQWFRNGVAIDGATSASLTRDPATLADAGLYTLVATNLSGSTASSVAHVVVAPRPGTVASGQTASGRPVFTSNVNTLVALPDGGALVGGVFSNVNGSGLGYLVRVHPDGSLDTSFNLSVNSSVSALLAQPDGKILVGGQFTQIGGTSAYGLARLNADLTLDTAFTANAYAGGHSNFRVDALALDSTGRIYTGRNQNSYPSLSRFGTDGVRDTGYFPAVNSSISALAMQPGDKLVVAGAFTSLAGSSAYRLGRLNTDGTRDSTFAPNSLTNAVFSHLLVLPDGRLVAAGSLGSNRTVALVPDSGAATNLISGSTAAAELGLAPGSSAFVVVRVTTGSSALMRFLGSDPLTSTDTDSAFGIGTGPTPGAPGAIDHAADGSIWVAGTFTSFDGFASGSVVKLQGVAADPAIVNHPVTTGVSPGATARFAVGATGTGLSYQWFKDGEPLADDARVSGSATAILSIADATPADAADYTVAVTGGTPEGTLVSSTARLYVLGAPEIAVEPVGPADRLYVGQTLALGAEVYAAAPATYAWTRDGQILADDARISGATTASLAITGLTEADTGAYTLTITNAQGAATTVPAFVLVAPVPDARPASHGTLASNRSVGAFLPLPDGRMLIGASGTTSFTGGTGGTSTSNTAFALVNPDGSVSPAGSPVLNLNSTSAQITAMLRLPDGKYLVGGSFTTIGGLTRNRLARLNADFSVDTTFDVGTGPNNTVRSLAVDASGRIYVGGDFSGWDGQFYSNGGPARGYLVRLAADGAFDDTFTVAVNQQVEKILPLPDGGFLVGGNFYATGVYTASYLLRLDSDGVRDAAFTPTTGAGVADLALNPAGDRIYVAFTSSPFLRRYELSGATDTAFAPTVFGQNSVRRLAVQPDGKIVAYGSFTGISNSAPYHLVRLLENGASDPSFTLGNTGYNLGSSVPNALALDASGRIWIGGSFTSTVAGSNAIRLLILNGDLPDLALNLQPLDREADLGGSTTFTASARSTGAVAWQWFRDGSPLSDDGRISGSTTASLTIVGLLRGDSADYTAVATRVDASAAPLTTHPAELAVLAEPEILASPFAQTLEAGLPFSFTAKARGAGVLAYQWLRGGDELPGQTTATLNLPNPATADTGWYRLRVTNTLGTAMSAPVLITFAQYAGGPASGLTLPGFNNGQVSALIPLANGGFLAGGSFTSFTPPGGVSTNLRCFAPISAAGVRDTSFDYINNSGTPTVTSVVRDSQGRTIFAGNFNTISNNGANVTRYVIVRLDANGRLDTGWTGPFGNVSNPVTTITTDASDRVLVGGTFANIAGLPNTSRIARLDAVTGAVDATFVPPSLGNVSAIHVRPDGRILVGHSSGLTLLESTGALAPGFTYSGYYSVLAIQPLPDGGYLLGTNGGVQRIGSTGALASPFPATGTGTFSTVRTILALPGGDFLIGGDFTSYNNVSGTNYLTKIHADGTLATGFNFGTGFNGSVYTLSLDASNRVWVGGNFTSYRGATANRILVLNTTDFVPEPPPPPEEETDPFASFLENSDVPEGQRGATDDPDGDGIPNLLEFALGLAPMTADSDGLPVAAKVGDELTLTYVRARPGAVTYEVQTTADLATPASWTTTGVDQGTPAGDGVTTARVTLDAGPRFLRLHVTLIETP